MRDGVRLSADVYLPSDGLAGGPYPTILWRSPYGNQDVSIQKATCLAERGFANVLVDVRGRHDSDGEWLPFFNEYTDGYDSVEWAAAQTWSNGRIGMMGGSYGGWVQWAAARGAPPHLVTLASSCPGGRWMEEIPYNNGVVMLLMLAWLNLTGGHVMQPNNVVDWEKVFRHLPLRSMDSEMGRPSAVWQSWLDHPTLDDFWKAHRLSSDDFSRINIPVLHLTGWYDADQQGTLYFYDGMRDHSPARDQQYIVIGPWDHAGVRIPRQMVGGVDFSPASLMDMTDLHRRWFDHWLRTEPSGPPAMATSVYFLTGINQWREGTSWPPQPTPTSFFLHSQGRANTLMGDGMLTLDPPEVSEPPDSIDYSPEDPVISRIDWNFYGASPPLETPLDRRFIQRREDVLVYTSEPLAEPLSVVGRALFELTVESDCPDTDFVGNICDVNPNGGCVHLGQGLMRARFRESLEREVFMAPGESCRVSFETGAFGHVFKTGHRIRVTVTSSDFPIHDRNPNTGHPIGADAETRTAHNSVLHDPEHPSRVVLPVILA